MIEVNKNRVIYLEAAYGYCMGSKYNNLDKCMKEADKNLYEHKKKLKSKSRSKMKR